MGLKVLLPFGLGAKMSQAEKERKSQKRMAGDNKNLYVDQYGVIRTLPGQLVQPGLQLDTSGGASAPLLDATGGGELLAPGSFYQTQRLLGLQGAADERSKAQRLAEDQYKITSQLEKDRAARLGQMIDFRQRVGTRGALIQQGQIGNQELTRQAMSNMGQVFGQAPQLQ
jgi:hypothetical protein